MLSSSVGSDLIDSKRGILAAMVAHMMDMSAKNVVELTVNILRFILFQTIENDLQQTIKTTLSKFEK